MNFSELAGGNNLILTEGSVVERIRRESGIEMSDDGLLTAALIYDERGRETLEKIYRQYLDIGKLNGLPVIVMTPTWRANKERIACSPYKNLDVNADCFRFIDGIRRSYVDYGKKIYVGGLTGCRHDAYKPQESISTSDAIEFHRDQIFSLASAGIDFLIAETLPALPEAVGISLAMAETGKPYVISFVIRADGCLLDGTPLKAAINGIDSAAEPRPLFYMVNCVHPSVLAEALAAESNRGGDALKRLIGIQANTSSLTPEELDRSVSLRSDDENSFYESMKALRVRYGLKIFGGCCGTTQRHMAKLSEIILRRDK